MSAASATGPSTQRPERGRSADVGVDRPEPGVERAAVEHEPGPPRAHDVREGHRSVPELERVETERRRDGFGPEPDPADLRPGVEDRERDFVVQADDVDRARVAHQDVGAPVREDPLHPRVPDPLLPATDDGVTPRRRRVPLPVHIRLMDTRRERLGTAAVRFVQDRAIIACDAEVMERHIDLITLRVEDLAAATRYYVDGLGWEPILAVPDEVTFLQLGPRQVLALFVASGFDADVGAAAGVQFNVGQVVATEAEVRAVIGRLVDAGGRVLKEPQHAEWGGYHGLVLDGAGCCWEIAYNPGWHVADDGTVSIGAVA